MYMYIYIYIDIDIDIAFTRCFSVGVSVMLSLTHAHSLQLFPGAGGQGFSGGLWRGVCCARCPQPSHQTLNPKPFSFH